MKQSCSYFNIKVEILWSETHPKKHSFSKTEIDFGNSTEINDWHHLKHWYPIESNEFGRNIVVKVEQPIKTSVV